MRERHRGERVGWLRAAVLNANDGIVSTASLVVGVAASQAVRHEVPVAGGASAILGASRVGFWGIVALAATAAIGKLFGTTVG